MRSMRQSVKMRVRKLMMIALQRALRARSQRARRHRKQRQRPRPFRKSRRLPSGAVGEEEPVAEVVAVAGFELRALKRRGCPALLGVRAQQRRQVRRDGMPLSRFSEAQWASDSKSPSERPTVGRTDCRHFS